jgi:hypothetical protein
MSGPTVVLVHGGFVDGSGWRGVHDALSAGGSRVVVVLAVISEAGTHPAVAALVYITAFAPDAGESVQTLIADPPPGAAVPPILPPREGFLLLDEAKFHGAFAADLTPEEGRFLGASQVPWASAPSPERSLSQRGDPSRAGIWSRPTTT